MSFVRHWTDKHRQTQIEGRFDSGCQLKKLKTAQNETKLTQKSARFKWNMQKMHNLTETRMK